VTSAELMHDGLDPAAARTLTDRIKVALEATWQMVIEAYQGRAWVALGYSSWDDYCTREFGTARLRLPREERDETVASLRDAGLSVRAIAAATGLGRGTVARSASRDRGGSSEAAEQFGPGVPNGTPGDPGDTAVLVSSESATFVPVAPPASGGSVTGIDGKRYARKSTTSAVRVARVTPEQQAVQALTVAWNNVNRFEDLVVELPDDVPAETSRLVAARVADLMDALIPLALRFGRQAAGTHPSAHEMWLESSERWVSSLASLFDGLGESTPSSAEDVA